jgi:glycosyltransferase involved in cell wall biosynthesis
VKYLGPKYNNELFDIIRKAKFVIQPSKWYENCPMTVIGSFACGTPVIASNHSGFKELITQNQNGYLLDFRNLKIAERKIKDIFLNYKKSMIHNCFNTFITNFRKDLHISKVLDVYKQ